MKKRFDWIVGGLLGLFLAVPAIAPSAMAQEDGYITPTKSRELRAKAEQERKAAEKKAAERRAAEEAKYQESIKKYEEGLNDWYNRRDMKVTIEEMEQNLEQLDGTPKRPKGGQYSNRLRRFSKDSDVLVLENVGRVYVMDDYDYYDPWSNSYFGRDRDAGVNIIINQGGRYGYDGFYGSYYPWYNSRYYYRGWYNPYYYSWYTPWDSWGYPWYDPWYDPWYSPWYGRYTYSWGYSRPWRYGGYYGYNSYWDGYYDGVYSRHYYTKPRYNYNSYGRSSGGYYDRSRANSEYGRALGMGTRANAQTRVGDTYNRGYYDRNTGWGTNTGRRSGTTRSQSESRSWNRNQNTRYNNNSSSWGSSTRSSGSYSSPSRSSSSSSSRSSGSSGSTSRSSGSSGRTR